MAAGAALAGITFREHARLRRIRRALRHSEQRHRGVTDAVPEAMLSVDADGRVESANAAAERLLGAPPAGLVGSDLRRLLPAGEGRDVWGELTGGTRPGDAAPGRHTARRCDGTDLPVRLAIGEIRREGRPAFVVVLHDESSLVAAEARYARMADQQRALARIATEVASDREPEELFPLVAEEAAASIGADIALVGRYVGDDLEVLGLHGAAPSIRPGLRLPLHPDGVLARVARERRTLEIEDINSLGPAGVLRAAAGARRLRGAVAAPVVVGGQVWGAIAVGSAGTLPPGDVTGAVEDFARLVTTALSQAEAHTRLRAQAVTDPLTGLANQRIFWERLAIECERAGRHGCALCLVMLDIDEFKQLNDTQGHRVGDRALAEVGARLSRLARSTDLLARIGGDEFGLIMPEACALGGHQLAERARAAVAADPIAGAGRLTVSAGICDATHARTPEALFRLADGALYWAKAQGRNAAYVYSPEIVTELSAQARRDRLAREQALAGLRALARAVDAKDPDTRRHSARVAELAVAIAGHLGWDEGRCALLHEAALLHDVGKIGVPDAVLFKPSSLSSEEFRLVTEHAALGAEIAAEVLSPEQAAWIHHHHERWDGSGYPGGRRGGEIPAGARIIALADSWDVMTSVRTYKRARSVPEALAEVRACRGTQFCPDAVAALEALAAAGALCPEHAVVTAGAPTA